MVLFKGYFVNKLAEVHGIMSSELRAYISRIWLQISWHGSKKSFVELVRHIKHQGIKASKVLNDDISKWIKFSFSFVENQADYSPRQEGANEYGVRVPAEQSCSGTEYLVLTLSA